MCNMKCVACIDKLTENYHPTLQFHLSAHCFGFPGLATSLFWFNLVSRSRQLFLEKKVTVRSVPSTKQQTNKISR